VLGASFAALVAAAAACCFSTAAMVIARRIEGQPTLFGLPRSHLYQACITLTPFLLITALVPIAWARAIRRAERGDRLAVACMALAPLAWIWYAALLFLFSNAERAFP
jgi:hypothetical protein